jgi:hypothetical protein
LIRRRARKAFLAFAAGFLVIGATVVTRVILAPDLGSVI